MLIVIEIAMGISVFTYSSNLHYSLVKEENKILLENIDLLIDGAFEADKVDYSRPWCGSKNQRYHFLTKRYNEDIFEKYKNKIEINISKNGDIFMNGMGNFDEIQHKIDLTKLI